MSTSQDDPSIPQPALRLRITHITSTQSPPIAPFANYYRPPQSRATSFPPGILPDAVPVLRIFGTTPALQKVCANVHICYPYFFVPFPMDTGSGDPLNPKNVNDVAFRFAMGLNHAICLASRQDPHSAANVAKHGSSANPKHLHVASVSIVKAVPFYGYHIGYSYYLKVSLVSPSKMYVALEQLRKPAVMQRIWQPHESHLNHVLQFMADFDLYGCGWLDIETGKFREPLPPGDPFDLPSNEEDVDSRIFDELTTPDSMRYNLSPPKDTYAPLEIDILPNHIINRMRLAPRDLHHDFVELRKQPLDPYEKLVRAVKELWEDEKRRRVMKGLGTSEADMMPKEHEIRTPAELGYLTPDQPENRGGNWHISEELWEDLELRMKSEKEALGGAWDFEGFAKAANQGKNGMFRKYEKWIMTSFQAVSAHWPKLRSAVRPASASVSAASSMTDNEENPFEVFSQQQRDLDAYDQQKTDADVDAAFVTQMQEECGEDLEVDEGVPVDPEDGDIVDSGLNEEGSAQHFREMLQSQSREAREIRQSQRQHTPQRSSRRADSAGLNGDVIRSQQVENPFLPPLNDSPKAQPVTPRSLARNQFSLPRPTTISPLKTPTKPSRLRHNMVMLTTGRRSAPSQATGSLEDTPLAANTLSGKPETRLSTLKRRRVEGDPEQAMPAAQPSHLQAPSATLPTVIPETVWSPTEKQVSNERFLQTMLQTPAVAAARGRAQQASDEQASDEPVSQTMLQTPALQAALTRAHLPKRARFLTPESDHAVDAQILALALETGEPRVFGAWFYRPLPPALNSESSLEDFGMETMQYRPPYYSNRADVPALPKTFAGRQFILRGDTVADLDDFISTAPFAISSTPMLYRRACAWEYTQVPPRARVVAASVAQEQAKALARDIDRRKLASQIDCPTQKSHYGFKYSQKNPSKASQRQHQNMSVLALEVFAPSREHLLPDPDKDAIAAIFYCYQNEDFNLEDTTKHQGYHAGYVVVGDHHTDAGRARLDGIPCHYVDSEMDLFNWIVDIVKAWDPDVLAGWELHNSSWGYLASRALADLDYDICDMISRVRTVKNMGNRESIYDATHTTTFKVNGRHVLNIWRILRSEINLTSYSFENVVFHMLHQRIPRVSSHSLTALWRSKAPEHTVRVMKHVFERVVKYVELLDAAEVVTKNAEFARVFGVDFASVLTRGSQYKVESFMIRIAKPESFMLVSPSKEQVGMQNAPDAIPLIAEPESKYYNHPIVVLDFQSLYPSVMIAYNLCYSTCLGRVRPFKGTWKFGFDELRLPKGTLELLKPYLTVTPNGMVFVKPAVRKSCLAKMLGEILDTRVMIKTAMKGSRGDKALTQLLNARQLGLKLMANVTYGYTSATFSGRMPCIEIADSIVQTGRETLMKAHDLIHSREDWGATVVYGDTDSLFLSLPGKTKEQAFRIGNEIADAVTAINPKPVKLKFEKVYMGSVLMAKKRYVGNKFENVDEVNGAFDAKGIETVRRDGFPAQSKLEEICLKKLFTTQDLSQVKAQCQQEWSKIIQGKVSLQDFIFAKEVRLGSYSDNNVPPPGVIVATRRLVQDPRDEAQYGERVPYIIAAGESNRLVDKARTPEEMLANRSLRLDTEYYIRKGLIPCLSRIFNLIGADVESWYNSMSKTFRVNKFEIRRPKNGKIDGHFHSSHCISCGAKSEQDMCDDCCSSVPDTSHNLMTRFHTSQRQLINAHRICASCAVTPLAEPVLCNNIDCPSLYARVKAEWEAEDSADLPRLVASLTPKEIEW